MLRGFRFLFIVALANASEAEEQPTACVDGSSCPSKDNKESPFLIPELESLEISPIIWRDDKRQADEYGRVVGLPPSLTREIREYCDRIGMTDLFRSLLYDEDGGEEVEMLRTMKDGTNWTVYNSAGAGTNWKDSDMHWVEIADEGSFEEQVKVLAKGGMDELMEAMSKDFKPTAWELFGGFSFTVVSYCKKGRIHSDIPGAGKDLLSIYFPLILPGGNQKAQLNIMDHELHRIAPIDFEYNKGVILSGDTYHGTGSCDYRESKDFRVAVAIWIADVRKDNMDALDQDVSSFFPPGDDFGEDWVFAQQGRLWGGGNKLRSDKGRKPFKFYDSKDVDCPTLAENGKCEYVEIRGLCPKSCHVYIDDKHYYARF